MLALARLLIQYGPRVVSILVMLAPFVKQMLDLWDQTQASKKEAKAEVKAVAVEKMQEAVVKAEVRAEAKRFPDPPFPPETQPTDFRRPGW